MPKAHSQEAQALVLGNNQQLAETVPALPVSILKADRRVGVCLNDERCQGHKVVHDRGVHLMLSLGKRPEFEV